jgi:pimeloyl-ACP methyl ester carboxylesterase
LLDHLQISRANIVGMSLGGVIATDFVLSHPERSASLVLIASNLGGFPHPAWGDRFTKVFEAGRNHGLPGAKELWLRDRFVTPVFDTARVWKAIRSMVADCPCPQLSDPGLMPAATAPPAFGRLETIAVPTLVINGEADDPDMLAIAEAIQTRVPGAQRLLVPKAGHLVNLEQPAVVNKALLAFLKNQVR